MAIPPVPPSLPGVGAGATSGIGQSSPPASGFTDAVREGVQNVSDMERAADAAIQDVATGGDTSIQELMTSTAKAQLGVELMTQVRDKAVEAYQEIMRMQV